VVQLDDADARLILKALERIATPLSERETDDLKEIIEEMRDELGGSFPPDFLMVTR
jgi:hypothetical protein